MWLSLLLPKESFAMLLFIKNSHFAVYAISNSFGQAIQYSILQMFSQFYHIACGNFEDMHISLTV